MSTPFMLATLFCSLSITACSQTPATNKPDIKVGGSCEGCEAVYECPVPFDQLNEVDTLPDFNDPGPKMEISGIVYKADGKTAAAGVIIYIYHTDQAGIYPRKGTEKGWARRHGYLRGWVKTDAKGFYKFYSLLPASYPNSNNPKHIHPVIKEPGKSEYYIDEFLFDNDPLLTREERDRQEQRGGNGILVIKEKNGRLYAERNIILGKNIPGYPAN